MCILCMLCVPLDQYHWNILPEFECVCVCQLFAECIRVYIKNSKKIGALVELCAACQLNRFDEQLSCNQSMIILQEDGGKLPPPPPEIVTSIAYNVTFYVALLCIGVHTT